MTANQVSFIVETIYQEDVTNLKPTALLNNMMIVVTKEANLYSDIERWRYIFDFDNNILKQIMVRRVDEITYGMIGESRGSGENLVYYEYLTDKTGTVIANYFDFDKIVMFVPQTSKVTAVDTANAIALSYIGGDNND